MKVKSESEVPQSCPTFCDSMNRRAHKASLPMEFWSGLQFPSPVDLPNPGIEPGSPALQADSLLTELQGKHLTTKVEGTYSLTVSKMTMSRDEYFAGFAINTH